MTVAMTAAMTADGGGTEDDDPSRRELDLLSTDDLVAVALDVELQVADAVRAARRDIARVAELAVARLSAGGRMIYVGAGTAGRLAALDATELPRTVGVRPGTVIALVAGGQAALLDAREGDEDDADAGIEAVAAVGTSPGDLVIGVSASGRTPFVVAALAEARHRGAATAALVNNPGTELAAGVDRAIELLTGPELVVGSTRLKAGTAQKMALDVISTAVMIRTGHTFGNLMVAAPAVNAKLVRRAVRGVALACGVEPAAAQDALSAAGGSGPLAIVMLRRGLDATAAREALDAAGGRVREASAGR